MKAPILLFVVLLVLSLSAKAAPAILATPTFVKTGPDVVATFVIRDAAPQASQQLPLNFNVILCEDDFFGNDTLGSHNARVPPVGNGAGNSSATGSGGYQSPNLTLVFEGAADDDDDYFLLLGFEAC